MKEQQIAAYFHNEDDAYEASIHLQAIGGVRDIATDQIPEDDGVNDTFFAYLPTPGQTTMSTTINSPFPLLFGNDMDDEQGAAVGRRGRGGKRNVLLTCVVDESKMHEVIEAIIRSGGSVDVG